MKTESSLDALFGQNPYQKLVAQVRDVSIFLIDVQGHVASWNEGAQLLFGYEDYEIVGEPFDCLFTPEDRENETPQIELSTAKNEGCALNVRWHLRKDGSRFWANGVTTAIRDNQGNLQGFAKIARDDTARKHKEMQHDTLLQQLKFEQERLATIFQNSPAFIAVLRGPEHVFELSNPAYYQLVGHRDIIGKPLLEALPEIEGQGFTEALSKVFCSGETFEGHEVPIQLQRTPDGPIEERYVDLLYLPLVEADGTFSGVFAHGVDVTDQVHARLKIEETNRIKDEFLATLSHELRTPLNAIMGWASTLLMKERTREIQQQGLEAIERNSRFQAQLIDDLLDVSRILTGKMRLDLHTVELSELLQNAVHNITPSAQAKQLNVAVEIDSSTGFVLSDSVRMSQVLWNLLSNAVKFTPKGGCIRVSLERFGSQAQVQISDDGKGIAPEFLPHVFERFSQADASSTRAFGGLGIGLALVRHLAEAHGGTIQAESEGVDKGATFTLLLPLVAVRPRALEETHSIPATQREIVHALETELPLLAGLRILVVDDERDARILLKEVLTERGASVEVAESASAALALIKKRRADTQPFDVLVSDIGMPNENGHCLLKQLRCWEGNSQSFLPAIALTAYASPKDRIESLLAGFQVHICKPVDPLELIAAVGSLTGRTGHTH